MEHEPTQALLSFLTAGKYEQLRRKPNYWASHPSDLITTCNPESFVLGTGASIFESIQDSLESTEHELIFVTCFWANSISLDILRSALRCLSDKAIKQRRKIRVRICVSSVSLFQKLFHTQNLRGYIYPPATWTTKLGLPSIEELAELDLQIKSIFVKPFSVMHPKFIIIDRKRVLLPSCNVSWEDWFEGCLALNGKLVDNFVRFYDEFWKDLEDESSPALPETDHMYRDVIPSVSRHEGDAATSLPVAVQINAPQVQSIFLPSPHNINPKFRLPWQEAAAPPNTPLNGFLLALFRTAKRNIYIQTPNVTAPPVLSALLQTLQRGVDIHIVTSERLMVLEQLVTAGTTTSRCMQKLVGNYTALRSAMNGHYGSLDGVAEEGRVRKLGKLKVEYYQPAFLSSLSGASRSRPGGEPVQSHLKLTIADDELVILGSGNLDRASWYTSQELGVAFFDPDFAKQIHSTLQTALQNRKKVLYDSNAR